MPSHRAWWFALLVVQIVIALSSLAIGFGLLLGTGATTPAPEFVADHEVRGLVIMLIGALTGAAAILLARGHRLALALASASSLLLMAWMHRVSVALGQHTAIGVFFMAVGMLELVLVLLVLGVQRGVPAPRRPGPPQEPGAPPHDDLEH